MEPFVFNKNSWHYTLATEWGGFSKYRDDSNICEYTHMVVKGVALASITLAIMALMAYWVTITLVWWVVVIQHGFFAESGPIVLSLIVAIVTFSFVIGEGIPWLFKKARIRWYKMKTKSTYHEAVEEIKTDNFLSDAYRSWKEKTCVRVSLVDDNENN